MAMDTLENLETLVFQSKDSPSTLEDGYYLKRRAALIKRMLRMTSDLLPKLNVMAEANAPLFQDLKEAVDRLSFSADELLENAYHLLNIHLSLASHRTNEASHRTNEVMRVLTLFSVFFLPLNFIASIYGMNFEHMPELKVPAAYPAVLILMGSVALGIYIWFRQNGWLKGDQPT